MLEKPVQHQGTGWEVVTMTEMPESIRDAFEQLREDVLLLETRWEIYRQLFDHSPMRLLFLDKCSSIFVLIEKLLVSDVQLSLSRLTDPARKGHHENLSLEYLKEQVEALGDCELSSRLRIMLDDLQKKCREIKRRRNKRLAHSDLRTSLQRSVRPMNILTRQMIEDALSLAGEYMNTIQAHYCEGTVLYEHGIELRHDADSLVALLKFGFRFKELAIAGKIPDEELSNGRWSDA
jgi:hypothetical protein